MASPAVEAFRAKMDSIMENTIPLLEEATRTLENAISSAPPNTMRPASPIPASQPMPSFAETASEVPEAPITLPSPSNDRPHIAIAVEKDPFSESTRRWKETLLGITTIDDEEDSKP